MGEFNSEDHYLYYCGQESLRRNGVALIVNERVWNAELGCSLKDDRMISVYRQTIQHHSNPRLCPNYWCQRSKSWLVVWRPLTPFRINIKKKMSFSAQGVGMKSKKSRETQNKRQVWPWSMKWSRANGNRALSGEHTGHSKYLFPKTWDRFTHRHHQMVTIEIRLIMFFTAEDGEALYSQ